METALTIVVGGFLLVVVDLVISVILEGTAALGWHSLVATLRSRDRAHPMTASIGYLMVGAGLGWISVLIHPERIVPLAGLHGISIVVAPLAFGLVMQGMGAVRRAAGHPTTWLATFGGAAALAFAAAVVRFYAGDF